MRDEIDALAAAHPTRLRVLHTLTGADVPPSWTGARGRMDAAKTAWLFSAAEDGGGAPARPRFAVVCGPQGMLEQANSALKSIGLDDSSIVLLDA